MIKANAHFVECGGTAYRSDLTSLGETVYGDYEDYFISGNQGLLGYTVVCRNIDNTPRTEWGDEGGFYEEPYSVGYAMHMFDDGSILVMHQGSAEDETHYAQAVMIDVNGEVDTTWGYNGHYITDTTVAGDDVWNQDPANFTKVLVDDDGNIYFFAKCSSAQKGIHKVSSDGTKLLAKTSGSFDATLALRYPVDACWYDDNKTRIIVAFNVGGVIAINPTDMTLDTTWGGLGGTAGIAVTSVNANAIINVDDGFVIAHSRKSFMYVLTKLNQGGTALDTTWATNGQFGDGTYYGYAGYQQLRLDSEGYLYFLDSDDNFAGYYTSYILKLDSSGTVVADANYYSDGYVFPIGTFFIVNDILYVMTRGEGDAQYTQERWNTDLEFIDGHDYFDWDFNTFNGGDFLLDSYTRSSTTYTPSQAYSLTLTANLVGETVSILADGVVLPDQVVDDDNKIYFTQAYDEIHWGLKYESKLKPMRPVTRNQMMNKNVTVKEMGISLHNTDDITVGVDDNDMKEVDLFEVEYKNKSNITDLFTGTVAVSVPDGFSKDCPLQIITDSPLPCTVRSMIPKVEGT